MKQLKQLAWVAVAALMSVGFTACSDDDVKKENELTEQDVVNKAVLATKAQDKALLLVAFGSTWEAPQATFQKMQTAFKKAFPDMDVYFSFTSTICINKLRAEGKQVYYRPQQWLTGIGKAGYKEVSVQSLHIIPGEEFLEMQGHVKDFHHTPEFEKIKVYMGTPLLAERGDVEKVAEILHQAHKDKVTAGSIVTFMGHGNPETYNYGNGNLRYTWMEEELQKLNKNYYVATVDMEANFINDMLKRMSSAGISSGTVYCSPLMSVAGDHANNDMTGGRGEIAEEDSWRSIFMLKGFDCPLKNCELKGLGDYPEIVNIWVSHMKSAHKAPPMYPKEE